MKPEFYLKQLEPLVGGTIIGTAYDEDEFFALKARKGGKVYMPWFYRDDEANGPGSFEIQEER